MKNLKEAAKQISHLVAATVPVIPSLRLARKLNQLKIDNPPTTLNAESQFDKADTILAFIYSIELGRVAMLGMIAIACLTLNQPELIPYVYLMVHGLATLGIYNFRSSVQEHIDHHHP